MAMSSDFFMSAMPDMARAGQALMQGFLEFLKSRSPVFHESVNPPDPEQLTSLQKHYLEQQQQLWRSMLCADKKQQTPVVEADPGDRRFSASAWQSSPVYDYLRQTYLLNSRFIRDLAELVPASSDKAKNRALFRRASLLMRCRRPTTPRPTRNS